MTRRRYRYDEATKQMVEVGADWTDVRGGGHKSEEEIFGQLRTETGEDISTRRRHREYMKANGLALHSDFKEERARAAEERERRRAGWRPEGEIRESKNEIGRIAYELSQRRRR